jgi:hypothetical protein
LQDEIGSRRRDSDLRSGTSKEKRARILKSKDFESLFLP